MNINIIMYHTFLTCFVVLLSNQATRMACHDLFTVTALAVSP